jgi:predicted nucleotidyltransferase component of viral defense system
VVKGGCNLRFWLGSVRFSEDLDLDVIVTAKETLKRKVDRLLAEPLPTLLRTSGLRIASFSAPKQTDTTPRWKVMLEQSGIATPFHTKIEFSRRPSLGEHSYEAVSSALTSRYRMGPTIAAHYSSRAAIAQKIAALAHRTETQARDVFDLAHLLATTGPLVSLEPSTKRDLAAATDRALSVSYDDFSGQVTAFLEPEHRELYASRDAWDSLQSSVLDALEGARS